ncbi:tetratricopeptide repeat (TPR)-like superfamily protein [Tasmannia lanceolata]|uniref:tetratricopeptide repeat (TPR)-like superfamily protein n=1 Tax=Tasmannia lanceolata TaxID=3420 RepID=UPI0040631165
MNMYAKFGNLYAARHVFDQIPQRNQSSWNTMISSYVRGGLFLEAIGLFRDMWGEGSEPNGFVLASIITACNRSMTMVCQGIQVHALVVKIGMLIDVFVSTSLLNLYGSYGFMDGATQLFDEMPERNVVSWTSLMVGHSKNGEPGEAMKIYRRMRKEGISCNPNSFATVISSCGLLEDQLLGCQVLAHVVISGFETNVSVANSLISMFGSAGCVEDARYVFDTMEDRDTISWNSMISVYSHNGYFQESLGCFYHMRCGNIEPDSTTLSSLISACSCMENVKWGRGLHGLVVKLGCDSVSSVCNTLVTMYSIDGRSRDAELVFLLMPERDLISWNSMMASYVQSGQYRAALGIMAELLQMSKGMNYVTFATALTACSSPETLFEGKMVHTLIIHAGLQENLLVGNALVTMYGKCGAMGEAKCVFQTVPERDTVTWNAMIGGHADNEEKEAAMKVFNLMREAGKPANYITMVNILGACSVPDDLSKYGMPIHAHIVTCGFDSDGFVQNSLLTMYAKCRELDSSNFIFNGLVEKNVVSWNALIAGNAHQGHGEEALKLLVKMVCAGLKLDKFSLCGGLAACASLAVLEEGRQVHNMIIKLGFDFDLDVMNAAMDMYGKCGEMDDVLKICPKTNKMSRLSWNILISGFARNGLFEKARNAFREMLNTGMRPDHVTFVSLLSACSHGGLAEEGLSYFSSMTSEFGIFPRIEHCVCIVDLLGRSGRLVDAERYIEEMPVPPNDLVWRSLLAACRIHGNLEMGRRAAECLLKLHPSDDSAYVLLSNVCAVNGRWDDVELVRSGMQLNNVKKRPACSWIKVKNEVNTFGMGDWTHPQSKQIHAKLEVLLGMIKEVGYVADTTFVLHDMDDEQKEHNLWNHSEKLALAFGLISLPEDSTIRIFKNLRVCGDCHSVYKLVSSVTGREIVLRDPYRFHHFNGGVCSCSDYW